MAWPETFTAANGTTWDTGNWTNGETRSGAVADVSSNTGRLNAGTSTGYAGKIARMVNTTNQTDAYMELSFRYDTSESFFHILLRSDATGLGQNSYDIAFFRDATNNVKLTKNVGWSNSNVAQATFAISNNTWYIARFQVLGSELKVWIAEKATGLTTPLITITDTSLTSAGAMGVFLAGGNNASGLVYLDDVSWGTPSSSTNASVTATQPNSTAALTAPTVVGTTTNGAPSGWPDTFTAPDGYAWSSGNWLAGETRTGAIADIVSNSGRLNAGTSTGYGGKIAQMVNTTAMTDTFIEASFTFDASEAFFNLLVRSDAAGLGQTGYELKVSVGTTDNLALTKMVSWTGSSLATSSMSISASTKYRARLQVLGSTISAWVWLAANTMPASPTITITDTSLTSGALGIWAGGGSAANGQLFVDDANWGVPTASPVNASTTAVGLNADAVALIPDLTSVSEVTVTGAPSSLTFSFPVMSVQTFQASAGEVASPSLTSSAGLVVPSVTGTAAVVPPVLAASAAMTPPTVAASAATSVSIAMVAPVTTMRAPVPLLYLDSNWGLLLAEDFTGAAAGAAWDVARWKATVGGGGSATQQGGWYGNFTASNATGIAKPSQLTPRTEVSGRLDVWFTKTTANFGFSVVVRGDSGGTLTDGYQIKLSQGTTNNVFVNKLVEGVSTTLATRSATITTGAWTTLEWRIVGTQIQVAVGPINAVPAWQVNITDTGVQQPGSVYLKVDGAASAVYLDSLRFFGGAQIEPAATKTLTSATAQTANAAATANGVPPATMTMDSLPPTVTTSMSTQVTTPPAIINLTAPSPVPGTDTLEQAVLTPPPAVLTATAPPPGVTVTAADGVILTPPPGVVTLAANPGQVTAGGAQTVGVTLEPASLVLAALPVAPATAAQVSAPPSSAALTGGTFTVTNTTASGVIISVPPASLTTAVPPVVVHTASHATSPSGVVNFTAPPPSITTSSGQQATLSPPPAVVMLESSSPSVTAGVAVTVPAGEGAFTGSAPAATAGVNLVAAAGILDLEMPSPHTGSTESSSVTLTLPAADMTLTAYQPHPGTTTTAGVTFTAPTLALSVPLPSLTSVSPQHVQLTPAETQFALTYHHIRMTDVEAPMAWATVEDVELLTSRQVTPQVLQMAQGMVEDHVNRVEGTPLKARDAAWLKKAVAWQAAWIPAQHDLVTRSGADAVTQDGASVQFHSQLDLTLAPNAQRCIKNLSWFGSRKVRNKTGASALSSTSTYEAF